MKAISIKQPWAGMIASGKKTIETRVWSTDYRGPLLVCSSLKPMDGYPWALPKFEVPLGVAICIVDLVGCRRMTNRDEGAACCSIYPDAWSWILRDVRAVEQIPVDDELIRPLMLARAG
jgi:hypothetical protein